MAASPFSTVGDLNAAYNELDVVAALRPPLKPRQWDDVFRRLVALVPVDDALPGGHEHYGRQSISDLAIQRLSRELVAERYQRRTGNPATRAAAERRLRPIVEAVQRRELTRSGAVALLMCTAANLRREGRFRALLLAWLRDMRERGVADDGALIGLIVLQSWGTDWTTASGPLIELLDHPSDEVRAYAANELGEVCVGAGRNPAPTADTFALIQAKEFARPGIAAPFWWGVEWNVSVLRESGLALPVDPKQWMFDTLTLRAGSDPASRHFNGLARVAGQLLGGDPQWIRRLMASGQWEAAQTAATEHESSEPEMKQILFDLAAETEDSFYLWEIAFRLAESHRTVLPQAAALGQVELLNAAKDADVFLISDDEASRRPRIAIVYPKAVGGLFTEARAWKWIDRLAPPTLRGEMSYRSLDGRSAPFANGVDVYFFGDGKRGPWHHIEVLANGIYETWDLRAAGLTP